MAVLTVQSVTKTGIANVAGALTAADADGDSVAASSGLLVALNNGDTSSHTLTVAAPVPTANCGNYGDLSVENLVLTVDAGNQGFLAIPNGYAQAGEFVWTYDAVTSVTVGVFSLSP